MGLFRDMLNEARNTSVPTEYRIALGQLKRMYNKGEVPSEKELQKDAEMIAKKNHLEEDKFFEFVKSQFKINESELLEAKMTAKEFIEDAEAYVKNIQHTDPKDSKLFKTKVIVRLKEKRNKATGNAKAELIKAIEELSNDGDLTEAKKEFDKTETYKLYEEADASIRKFGKNWMSLGLENKLERKEWNELRSLQGDATTKLAHLVDLLRVTSDKMNEAAVGQKGRTSYKEAMDYCEENEELVDEFRKIIKKLGGKTVAKALLDKLSQKPEIKDEIEHIEDIIDNSNY